MGDGYRGIVVIDRPGAPSILGKIVQLNPKVILI